MKKEDGGEEERTEKKSIKKKVTQSFAKIKTTCWLPFS